MKSSHLALATLLLGLGLGFAFGAVFQSGNGATALPTTLAADRSGGSAPSAFSEGSGRDDGLSSVRTLNQPSTLNARSATAVSTTVPASPEAQRITRQSIELANLSPEEDEAQWTHSIQGTVIDEDGQPLAGVQIVSMNRAGGVWGGIKKGAKTAELGRAWDGIPDVAEKVALNAQYQLENERNHRTATSDATGRFRLDGLREGAHSLKAYADGIAFAPQSTHTGRECSFVGEHIHELELDVRLPDGTQPESAVVFVGEKSYGNEFAWTPQEPRLRLKEAAFELTVRSGSVQRLDWRTTASDFSSDTRPINLELEGPGPHVVQLGMNQILRVSLEDQSTLVPKLPVWMKVASVTANAGGSADGLDWTDDRHSTLTLATSGAFQLMEASAGSYWLAAGRGDAGVSPELVAEIKVDSGVTEESITLGEVDLSEFLICRCVRSEGGPVADVTFEVAHGKKRASRVDAVMRGRGEYWLPRKSLVPEGAPEPAAASGTTELIAKSEIDGILQTPIEAGAEEITVEFQPACTLHLEVIGDVSAGYTVHANSTDAQGKPRTAYIHARTPGLKRIPEGGKVSIMALQPGTYEIEFYETGLGSDGFSFMRRSQRVTSESVEIKNVETTLGMTLPTFQKLVIHAPNIAAGERFTLSRKDGDSLERGPSTKVDDAAMAVFDRVASGEYSLSGPDRKEPMEVSVPTGEIQWLTDVIDAARVRSVEADGPAHQAGLRKDDLVVAVDGVPVKGQLRSSTLAKNAAEQSVRLTVLRSGASLDVSVGPLGENGSIGCSLTSHTLAPGERQ